MAVLDDRSRMVRLPLPPTANKLYRNLYIQGRPGRAKTADYRNWLAEVGPVLEAGLERLPEKTPIAVRILTVMNRTRDLDNTIKPLIDAVAAAGKIANDRWVDSIVAECDRSTEADKMGAWIAVEVL